MGSKMPGYDRKIKYDHSFPPQLYLLLDRIVGLRHGKQMMHDIGEYFYHFVR
jgi:hypothetical protein